MKQLSFLFAFVLLALQSFSQIAEPVKWTFDSKQNGNEVQLIFKASIDKGWHLYDINLPDGGPVSTSFHFKENKQVELVGKMTAAPAPINKFDKTFGMDLRYYADKAEFYQTVKLKTNDPVVIEGYLEFMCCNDETCMPPTEIEFKFTTKAVSPKAEAKSETPVANTSAGEAPAQLAATNSDLAQPQSNEPAVVPEAKPATDSAVAETAVAETSASPEEAQSYWHIFIIAFLAGFAALLTPCVFPMIPMTVSFFTKQSKNRAMGIRNALFYGISIIVIYVLLGTVVVAIFGAGSLNALSSNPIFNLFFFVLLVVFAISFLGAFEIVLPSSWVNMADKNADRGGILGIFFMAFTLALVSFSCTGPLVGTIIVEAARNGGMAPVIGMFGFSLAIALPFAFFAAFPGYLNSLPKSGGWLNSVKVVLGFLELAFAFKFLSNADMALDLHLLQREVFIAIWIAIFGMLALYLFGKIKLPHDSPMDHLPVSRLLLGITVLAFTIYLVPGLWGAPVKIISGFPPSSNYAESPLGVGREASVSTSVNAQALPEGMHAGPQNIPAFDDYEQALAYARKVNKPLMLDFTGKTCVNCRKMEDNVWSDPHVKDLLSNEYVLVSLYVDLRKDLPENEVYVSKETGRKVRNLGQKWADFQLTRFQVQGQPYYVLLDTNEQPLVSPHAFDLDVKTYQDWLQSGLDKFKQK